MSDTEIKAAAERLIRMRGGDSVFSIYEDPKRSGPFEDLIHQDLEVIADAYLTLQPRLAELEAENKRLTEERKRLLDGIFDEALLNIRVTNKLARLEAAELLSERERPERLERRRKELDRFCAIEAENERLKSSINEEEGGQGE